MHPLCHAPVDRGRDGWDAAGEERVVDPAALTARLVPRETTATLHAFGARVGGDIR